jgi:hypothetical protein
MSDTCIEIFLTCFSHGLSVIVLILKLSDQTSLLGPRNLQTPLRIITAEWEERPRLSTIPQIKRISNTNSQG